MISTASAFYQKHRVNLLRSSYIILLLATLYNSNSSSSNNKTDKKDSESTVLENKKIEEGKETAVDREEDESSKEELTIVSKHSTDSEDGAIIIDKESKTNHKGVERKGKVDFLFKLVPHFIYYTGYSSEHQNIAVSSCGYFRWSISVHTGKSSIRKLHKDIVGEMDDPWNSRQFY